LYVSIRDIPEGFSASSNFVRLVPEEQIPQHLDKMCLANGHWWGEILPAANWRRFRPYFLEYYALIGQVDYGRRPHGRILELFRKHGFPGRATSQDGGRDMAVHAAGLARARLVVNRAIYIGQRGTHCTPRLFHQAHWGGHEPYVFADDERIARFEMLPPARTRVG